MSYRIAKVEQQIRRILAEFLQREKDTLGVGIISINDILVSRDLNTAKVWVSFIAETHPEEAFKRLLRHGRDIQTYLYRQFPVKKVPQIMWQLDLAPDSTYRVEKLLDDIRTVKRKNHSFPRSGDDGSKDPGRLPS